MKNSDVLAGLDLGSSVAENDANLASYFIPTVALNDFLGDRFDLIRGVKGSGKSALLRVVSTRQADYAKLRDVLLHVATEHTGEPSFKRAFGTLRPGEYSEAALVSAWKTYLLNLALDALEGYSSSSEASEAIAFAQKIGIRYKTTSPYKKVMWSLLRILHLKSFTVGADSVQAEFPDAPPEIWTKHEEVIDFPEALRLCVSAFRSLGIRCWILVDRLDAAFQDDYDLERAALKALLMAYKDFMGHSELRLKLFFRTDLFDQVTSETGFRELTHVLDRTSPPMLWDQDRLLSMIMERFVFNESIRDKYGVTQQDMRDSELRETTFFSIFPGQIDQGSRKSDSWSWINSRIRDSNGIRTPRDLHTLVINSVRKQQEFLAIEGDDNAETLISPGAVKAGLTQLSVDKVRTVLIAENAHLEKSIRAFQRGKAEHNEESLAQLLGEGWPVTTEALERIGFLEHVGESWKIPMLYRDGLEITQGAAFEK
ncbi:hypothetical protein L3V59_02400 [Burkholderia aenigmatica]|uniref:P-loop ATPase, Sll1717 family n=1 Tax=Burkholderia cepacia complex TaxID=87882 RepID=UPI00158A3F6B|nr:MULTISPECIES: hypothetical protein [Burkholderia cepacia complex]UKD11947.1 hypothetical protein L3V59_02400 [Burkholderia aenigmatica]